MFGTFKVMVPMFDRLDDRKHFAIVNVIIAFCGRAFARPECDGMEATFGVGLANNARNSEAG